MGAIGWNAPAKEPVAISGRRELFLDNTIGEQLAGGAQRVFPIALQAQSKRPLKPLSAHLVIHGPDARKRYEL